MIHDDALALEKDLEHAPPKARPLLGETPQTIANQRIVGCLRDVYCTVERGKPVNPHACRSLRPSVCRAFTTAFGGAVEEEAAERLAQRGIEVVAITPPGTSIEESMHSGARFLEAAAKRAVHHSAHR
jgi:hypothetical protein